MAPTGNNTEARIWNHLKGWILNDYGVAALMGNLYAESGLNPRNLQNSYEKRLDYTDDTYTAAGSFRGSLKQPPARLICTAYAKSTALSLAHSCAIILCKSPFSPVKLEKHTPQSCA